MNLIRRCAASPACWFATLLLTASGLSNLGSVGANADPVWSDPADGSSETKILREGTRLENRTAEVRQEAERLAIYVQDTTVPLITVENLAMQRLLQSILDDPNDKNWIVTGTVTEFQGRNYLLLERISRAARK